MTDLAQELDRLTSLKGAGHLTAEEFTQAKAALLSRLSGDLPGDSLGTPPHAAAARETILDLYPGQELGSTSHPPCASFALSGSAVNVAWARHACCRNWAAVFGGAGNPSSFAQLEL